MSSPAKARALLAAGSRAIRTWGTSSQSAPAGVALLAIQALEKRSGAQAREVDALRVDNAVLRAELRDLEALEQRMSELRAENEELRSENQELRVRLERLEEALKHLGNR